MIRFSLPVLMLACLVVAVVSIHAEQQPSTKENNMGARDDLHHMYIADGTAISIWVPVDSLEHAQESRLFVSRPKAPYEKNYVWNTALEFLDYRPGASPQYALANVAQGEITLFLTWNGHYFVIDEESGRVIGKGQSDDVLKHHANWVPLKLKVVPPSVGHAIQ